MRSPLFLKKVFLGIILHPLFLYAILVLILFLTNYQSKTFLTGWDNLHPEFNLPMNIQRSFFAVWQEYQGLGLLGGMGHAADLLRQLFLLILSFLLPMSMLRWAWTFITLLIGAYGTYTLARHLVQKTKTSSHVVHVSSIIAGLYYILNISTIQTYYVVFETFSSHFAALPWMLFSALLFLEKPTKKTFLFFSVVTLLATPQAYVPTLFAVTMLALGILSVCFLLFTPTKRKLRNIFLLFGGIFIINSFWLLPFIYFNVANVQVLFTDKINQMATQTIFLQNKEFGNIWDTMFLKGFWFNNVDPNLQRQFAYMFAPWRNYIANPVVIGIDLFFFSLVLLGAYQAIRSKRPALIGIAVLLLFTITILTTNTPPFSWVDFVLRTYIPLFKEAFRFPFTKFSILASLCYAISISLGISMILQSFYKKQSLFFATALGVVALVGVSVFPVFQGQLFYNKERLIIPAEYFQVFNFFNKQDPNTRIANLPQYSFWGWTFYTWGYGGSGFPWYGIKQPILDRNFDVWSNTNENYYWELSQAVYENDPIHVEEVLNKYQISWLMLDQNVYEPSDPKVINYTKIKALLQKIPEVKVVKRFGNIVIYHVSLLNRLSNFIWSTTALPSTNDFSWNNVDFMYRKYGTYEDTKSPHIVFPLGDLFSGKKQSDVSYTLSSDSTALSLSSKTISLPQKTTVQIPPFIPTEKILPITIYIQKVQGKIGVFYTINSPEIQINGRNIWKFEKEENLATFPESITSLHLDINGYTDIDFHQTSDITKQTFFLTTTTNVITITTPEGQEVIQIPPQILSSIKPLTTVSNIPVPDSQARITVLYPKIMTTFTSFQGNLRQSNINLHCNSFRKGPATVKENTTLMLTNTNSTTCLSFPLEDFSHEFSYVVLVSGKYSKGLPLHFWIQNNTSDFSPIDTYLPQQTTDNTSSFIVPPLEPFGQACTLHLDNISIGQETSKNEITGISAYQIPYNFISGITMTNGNINKAIILPTDQTTHPNESLYTLVTRNTGKQTVILSQSFDAEWNMYSISKNTPTFLADALPFLVGKSSGKHIKVNNWENGWEISPKVSGQRYVIVYLPQYLEYAGFLLLILTIISLVSIMLPSFHQGKKDHTQQIDA